MLKKSSFRECSNRTSKGFTLLEVMIVISIISILAGFLIPKFIGYENKAKTVKAINTGKQIYNAVMCAHSDYGSSITEAKVVDSVRDLVGISVGETGMVTKGNDTITVKYSEDNKYYNVVVTLSTGSYSVNAFNGNSTTNSNTNSSQIFSQTAVQN